jgi:hypothetical protein
MTQPMSRETMRELKASTEESTRIQQVKQIVSAIYRMATDAAKSKADTSYNHPLPYARNKMTGYVSADSFYIQNMPDILADLQVLFPGCDVTHTLLSKGTDGKMYDISKLDEKVLPFVNRALDRSYIVIDWS